MFDARGLNFGNRQNDSPVSNTLPTNSITHPTWLIEWMETQEITLWGAADLRNFSTPSDQTGKKFPFAISFVIPMNPKIMDSIKKGPNQEYADEYARVNNHINELATTLSV
ncbi:MAG: hypothetical protein RQ739_06595, partial [Desulfotignum sp.]|nr:hypothetical protein [Desulfotignum sp.]